VLKDGRYVLPSRGGIIVPDEVVERLLYRADAEDAGIVGGERGAKASLPAPEKLHDCCRKA